MALDTYLVVFHHFDVHSLHQLEVKYVGIISSLTFIPALVFLFIRTPERGPIYGSETVSCIVSWYRCAEMNNQPYRSGARSPPTGC